MLNSDKPDPRMRDVELALRYYAFKKYANKYSGKLKEFLDYACETLNNVWNDKEDEIKNDFKELENAIKFAYEILPEYPFGRYIGGHNNNRFNRSIFELLSYYFSDKKIRQLVEQNKDNFVSHFKKLNNSDKFKDAVSNTTKDINRVVIRFDLFSDLLAQLPNKDNIDVHISYFKLVDGEISIKEKIADDVQEV